MLVDSHCHLDFPELRAELPALLARMAAQGVTHALTISTTLAGFPGVREVAQSQPNLWCTAGVHPDERRDGRETTVEELVALADHPKVVAIGETGLDYFRVVGDTDWQRERFRVHIRAARACGLPLVVHTRSASQDTLDLLREEGGGAVQGVFHCFTETQEVADAALDMGFHISFSGILSFKNAESLRQVARRVPLDRCLIETDSPYLAPVPYRGKTNQPAYVAHVAAQLAQLKDCSIERLAEATSRNFARLFSRTNATTEQDK